MTNSIDERARRLVASVGEAAESPRASRPDSRALAGLDLRIREQLEEREVAGGGVALEKPLALNVSLAWLTEQAPPGPQKLVRLKTCIGEALHEAPKEERSC